ncbi:TetR/AcrR family transcriptional regulator [Heliophilum fasciatum]|uniref:TetR family transcriptional regulator n=1 Tax=Heliophilum fasciatum TaxID=35700 RepID=A0A4R2RJC5_9FIRM|nr:TetR/AcrR family transcriptional regulator [Heliophilum fasciatum]MCW2278297.1 AcrR family transcriptional regulator [Heliophilum fasciatum]TCP63920.1 TetR family transcriptional regulator [Heliophilum fasciatum]
MRKANQIFQGAVDAFAEKGFDRATMDEVAERAGVAKGTLYYHFVGKEELICFLMEEGIGQLSSAVAEAVAQTDDPQGQVRAAIGAMVAYSNENRKFCQLLVKCIWSNAERQEQFREILQSYFDRLTGILNHGIHRGVFQPQPMEWAPSAWFGLVTIVILRVILQGQATDQERLVDYLYTQYMYGIIGRDIKTPN